MTRPELLTCQSHRQPRYLRKMQSPVVEYVVHRPSRYSSPPPSYAMSQWQQEQEQQEQQERQLYTVRRPNDSNTSLPAAPPARRRLRRASVTSPDWSYGHGFSGRLPASPPPPAPMPPSRRARPVKSRKSCPDLWNAIEQVVELVDATACEVEQHMRVCRAHGEDIYGMVERTLDEVITLIDEGRYTRNELREFRELLLCLSSCC